MGFAEEIAGQPEALRRLIQFYQDAGDRLLYTAQRMTAKSPRSFVLTGMGSSDIASENIVPYLGDRSPSPVVRWEAGELLHYGLKTIRDDDIVVVISQSGRSVEAVRIAEVLRYHRGLISITNTADSIVAKYPKLNFPMMAGVEESVASTTYTNTLALLVVLSRVFAQEDWTPVFLKLEECALSMAAFLDDRRGEIDRAADLLSDAGMVYLVSRGPGMAAARWGSLVLQEAAHVHAAALYGASMRHGPYEIVAPGTHAVMFASEDEGGNLVRQMAAEMADMGCKVVLFTAVDAAESANLVAIKMTPGDSELFSLVCETPEALLLDRMARDRGLTPGVFSHGGKVTTKE